jgi:hypothetical protein
MYKNKNNSFFVGDNEEADRLLSMLESNSVLSESFKSKIINIVMVIITFSDDKEDWIKEEIRKLKEEMSWLTIFSEKFIHQINGELLLSLYRQVTINKQGNIVGEP